MDDKIRKKHESYGMVSLSRCSCGGKGVQLFGSSIKHSNFISLTIHEADLTQSPYGSHYMPKRRIIEVFLSPVQFTEMLTQMNTTGAPCTLKYTECSGLIENAPEQKSIQDEVFDDLDTKYRELARKLKILQDGVAKDLTGVVNKEAKERIKYNIHVVYNDINANLRFLHEQQTKKLQHVGTQIVAEAEATISNLIYSKGLEGLQETIQELKMERPPKQIQEE